MKADRAPGPNGFNGLFLKKTLLKQISLISIMNFTLVWPLWRVSMGHLSLCPKSIAQRPLMISDPSL
jgi:hypothetical protein